MKRVILAFLFLAGCASTRTEWRNSSGPATEQQWNMDHGFCRAQAFSAGMGISYGTALIEKNCMQGKGWYAVEVPNE